MSIESTPRVGLLERLKAATSLEQVEALAGEFSTFKYASDKTKRRVARVLKQKFDSLAK